MAIMYILDDRNLSIDSDPSETPKLLISNNIYSCFYAVKAKLALKLIFAPGSSCPSLYFPENALALDSRCAA
jgi:hypothetical protein